MDQLERPQYYEGQYLGADDLARDRPLRAHRRRRGTRSARTCGASRSASIWSSGRFPATTSR